MKKASSFEPIEENGKFLGFSLGADYTAEHEWGINGILRKFDIQRTSIKDAVDEDIPLKFGFVTNNRIALGVMEVKKGTYIYTKGFNDPRLEYLERTAGDTAAWDTDDFAIFISDQEQLKILLDAEKNNDLTITLIGSDSPFGRGGLAILINSLIPDSVKEERIKSEKELFDLYMKVKETGIEKILEDAGKEYFALSPTLQEDGTLKFWLNPSDQRNNNFGYYTIDELKAWTKNEGPIPKADE